MWTVCPKRQLLATVLTLCLAEVSAPRQALAFDADAPPSATGPFVGVAFGQDVMSSAFHLLQEAILSGTTLAEGRSLYAVAGWRFSDRIIGDLIVDYQERTQEFTVEGATLSEALSYWGLALHGSYFFADRAAHIAPFVASGLFLGIPSATVVTKDGADGTFSSDLANVVSGLWLTGIAAGGGMEWRATNRLCIAARLGMQWVHFSTTYSTLTVATAGNSSFHIPAQFGGNARGLETQLIATWHF